MARFLCCKERLEQLPLDLVGHSDSGVADLHPQVFAGQGRLDKNVGRKL